MRLGGLWSPRSVVAIILALTVCKYVVAALTPLAFDEALYWRYSKHLAAGFIDHPFMNPLMIRIGTGVFGDTPFGVRFMAVSLGLPASWAVWRAVEALFPTRNIGATAALIFNLTVVASAGSIIATSDQLVVSASALIVFSLAQVVKTGRGPWWLAVGVAMGLGLCCKYTTVFFGGGTLIWLAMSPDRRRWFISPWLWAGGALAVLVFTPVLVWNATHHWESFVYQAGRLTVYDWSGRYFGEFVLDLVGLATPPIFILGCVGLLAPAKSGERVGHALLLYLIAPMLAYFAWHATHVRVQGNWPEPIYPAFSIAAAVAVRAVPPSRAVLAQVVRWAARLTIPIGIGVAAIIYLEAAAGVIPLGAHDLRARALGVGWPAVAKEIDQDLAQTHARAILTTDYTLTGWIKFYLPSHAPVEQMDERVRWTNEPAPDAAAYAGPLLYVCDHSCWKLPRVSARFRTLRPLATIDRVNAGRVVSRYQVYELIEPSRPVFDPPNFIPKADHSD